MARKPGRPVLVLLPAMLALAACSSDGGATCGPGTEEQGGACVPVCGAGTERDASGACVPVCVVGMHRDPATGACLPEGQRCVSGQLWVEEQDRCVDAALVCASGTTWVASEARCVEETDLRVPDQEEGTEPNDLTPPPYTCETFPVPAVGGAYSFAGTVGAPEIAANGAVPDLDCWLFEIEEPTILRLAVDGLGATAPAFRIVQLDPVDYRDRDGVGATSRAAVRDLYLPVPGLYAAIVTDALNLFGGWPVGGPNFGYLAEVRRLPLPEPIVLDPDEEGRFSASGPWPRTPPEGETSVVLLAAPVPANSLYFAGVYTEVAGIRPLLGVTVPRGASAIADDLHMPSPVATAEAGHLLFGIDFLQWFAPGDGEWWFAAEPRELALVDGDAGVLSLEQAEWSSGRPVRSEYLGIPAEAGDVVKVDFSSSTGRTCVYLWNDGFNVVAGDRHCMPGFPPEYRGEIWFEAPYTGLYLASLQDYDGADVHQHTLVSIPRHSYEVRFGAHRQAPVDLGRLDEPWSSTETVSEVLWQRMFRLRPAGGDAFWFEIGGDGLFDPRALGYTNNELVLELFPEVAFLGTSFGYRSPDGLPLLFGVSDWEGRTGSFTLEARAIDILDLGELSAEHSIAAEEKLPAAVGREFFSFEARVPGRLRLAASPPGDVDLALVPLDPRLQRDEWLVRDDQWIGGEERLDLLVPAGTFLFHLQAHGGPFEADLPVGITAALEPIPIESEPNDDPLSANELPVPGIVAGENPPGESDWYRFELPDAATIDLWFRELGVGGFTSAQLRLFEANGTLLIEAGGDTASWLPELRWLSLPAGTYLLEVWVFGEDVRYAIEVDYVSY
jgi:hypothetical protein